MVTPFSYLFLFEGAGSNPAGVALETFNFLFIFCLVDIFLFSNFPR